MYHDRVARAALVGVIALAGCLSPRRERATVSPGTPGDVAAPRAGIAIVGRGGIEGLERVTILDSATARFVTVTRRPCDDGCAPLDSASGKVARRDVAHIYAVVEAEHVFSLREDYGVCATCADQAVITTAVFANSRRKVINSDGEQTPEILGRVHVAVAEAIRAARGVR